MGRDELIRVLEEEARTLERWAEESLRGGWSTHQVRPQKERAAYLWSVVGRARAGVIL
jgi:hypothetical protein